eukprot:scaffold128501_cov32-Tisochrysis_lutea.AAC.4
MPKLVVRTLPPRPNDALAARRERVHSASGNRAYPSQPRASGRSVRARAVARAARKRTLTGAPAADAHLCIASESIRRGMPIDASSPWPSSPSLPHPHE